MMAFISFHAVDLEMFMDDLMHSELPVATDHEDNTCMDEEIDDGEVWDMNIYDIDDDIQECTTKASNSHSSNTRTNEASRVVTFLSVLISKWSSRYNVSLAAVTALICIISWLFSILSKFSSFVGHLSSIFPTSLSGLNKYLEVKVMTL